MILTLCGKHSLFFFFSFSQSVRCNSFNDVILLVFLFVSLFICVSVYLFICVSAYLFVCLSVYLSVYMCVFPSIFIVFQSVSFSSLDFYITIYSKCVTDVAYMLNASFLFSFSTLSYFVFNLITFHFPFIYLLSSSSPSFSIFLLLFLLHSLALYCITFCTPGSGFYEGR